MFVDPAGAWEYVACLCAGLYPGYNEFVPISLIPFFILVPIYVGMLEKKR